MQFLKQTILTLALIAFIGMAGFGMFAMTGHHHEPGCPFMPGEQAICEMNIFDHISAWQNTFTGVLPSIFILILAVALNFVYWFNYDKPPDLRGRVSPRSSPGLNRPNLYQELFSSGILNPKAP